MSNVILLHLKLTAAANETIPRNLCQKQISNNSAIQVYNILDIFKEKNCNLWYMHATTTRFLMISQVYIWIILMRSPIFIQLNIIHSVLTPPTHYGTVITRPTSQIEMWGNLKQKKDFKHIWDVNNLSYIKRRTVSFQMTGDETRSIYNSGG